MMMMSYGQGNLYGGKYVCIFVYMYVLIYSYVCTYIKDSSPVIRFNKLVHVVLVTVANSCITKMMVHEEEKALVCMFVCTYVCLYT